MAPIVLYFDFLSPYAYIAACELPKLAARYGRTVEPRPVLLAALLASGGQKGPAEIPSKRVYVFKDVVRTAHALGLALSPPASHPFNSLLALRAASMPMPAEQRDALIARLWRASWGGERRELSDRAVVSALVAEVGLDPAVVLAYADGDAGKSAVRAQTEQAIARGAFGVPSIDVDGELYWGYDAFGHIERRLRGEDPLAGFDLSVWRDLPATAQRRT
jgi:2-hydroxychromene-2-carboxylate isomerase